MQIKNNEKEDICFNWIIGKGYQNIDANLLLLKKKRKTRKMHFHKNFIKRTFFVSSRKLISFLLFVAEWHGGTYIKVDSFIEIMFEKDIKVFKLIMRRIHVTVEIGDSASRCTVSLQLPRKE